MSFSATLERMFPGATDAIEAYRRGLAPNPKITISDWADKHRVLDSKSSKEAGRWSTDRTPYLREPMECMSPYSPVNRCSVMKGAQIGGSEMGLNMIGATMDVAACPIILVQPTGKLAERYSKSRLAPMIALCEPLRKKIPQKKSDGNTLTIKEFPGGMLVLASANSAAELRSMSACVMVFEEPDAFPRDVEGEGSAIDLVCARGATYSFRRKEFLNCTPTLEADSIIFTEYKRGDQRHYMMPCPHPECGKLTNFHRENFRHVRGKPGTAHFVCMHCDGKIEEGKHKTAMLRAAVWVPQNPNAPADARSYYMPSSLSPVGWKSWRKIAAEEDAAEGNYAKSKTLMNTVWGWPWRDSTDTPDVAMLVARARQSPFAMREIPDWVSFIAAGVDVGIDHIELGIWGFGRRGRRHHIEQIRIRGRHTNPETWRRLESALMRRYYHPSGAYLQIRRACIDRGFAPDFVDPWVARQDPDFIVAIKGTNSTDWIARDARKYYRTADGKPVMGVDALRFFMVGADLLKMELYNRLNLPWNELGEPPAGWITFSNDTAHEWFEQLVGEEFVVKENGYGRGKGKWDRKNAGTRVEALDCANYARVAAHLEGWDSWSDADFAREDARMVTEVQKLAIAIENEVRRRQGAKDLRPVGPADVGVKGIVLPGDWEDTPMWGVPVLEDQETVMALQDEVLAEDAARAEQPIHDEPEHVPEPPVPEAEEAPLPGLKKGWGGHDASKGIKREEAPGVAVKTGWGGVGGIPMPSFGSWADDD